MSEYWCCKAEFGSHELFCKNYPLPADVEAVLEAATNFIEAEGHSMFEEGRCYDILHSKVKALDKGRTE